MHRLSAPPTSRNALRRLAYRVRRVFTEDDAHPFPIVPTLELALPMLDEDFIFEVVDLKEMGEAHGETLPEVPAIRIRLDVYQGAVEGRGRDRMTLAHELGHLLLHRGQPLQRVLPGQKLKPYRDPEWQADVFAAELLMPYTLASLVTEASELQGLCDVSARAAEVQFSVWQRDGLTRTNEGLTPCTRQPFIATT